MSKSPAASPSSNWEKLKPTIAKPLSKTQEKKQRYRAYLASISHGGGSGQSGRVNGVKSYLPARDDSNDSSPTAGPSRQVKIDLPAAIESVTIFDSPSDSPLVKELRDMVAGKAVLNEARRAPGNYIAIDCEMVGTGPKGKDSAVARVSLVNYHGHILLDTFVRPKEMVTDFRTWISGVHEEDLADAPDFEVVQKKVNDLVEGRVLVGHAIDNDLKALLLSHPSPMIRDTQKSKEIREKAKSKHPALRKLAIMELGLDIQTAAHSSVTDARATMALYRIYKTAWELSLRPQTEAYRAKVGLPQLNGRGGTTGKRKRNDEDEDDDEEGEDSQERTRGDVGRKDKFPGGGRKGISSGLSVVVKRNGVRIEGPKQRGAQRGQARHLATDDGSRGGGDSWWEKL